MTYTKDYMVDVPEGESGDWKVEKWDPRDEGLGLDFFNMRNPGREIPRDRVYTRLTRNGNVIMSDTPAEIRDHLSAILETRRWDDPKVLIHGLGLGMVANACLMVGASHVTVIDKSEDVIKLVAPHWQEKWGEKLTIIQGDAYTWKPEKGKRWEVVWHDIWDNLCEDNLKLMEKLHRRFGRRCEWQDSWGKEQLKAKRRRRKRRGFRW